MRATLSSALPIAAGRGSNGVHPRPPSSHLERKFVVRDQRPFFDEGGDHQRQGRIFAPEMAMVPLSIDSHSKAWKFAAI